MNTPSCKRKPRWYHSYRISYAGGTARIRVSGLWILGVVMLVSLTMMLVASFEKEISVSRPFSSLAKLLVFGIFYAIGLVLLVVTDLAMDKKAETYVLSRRFLGLRFGRQERGPLSDIHCIIFNTHEVEDTDTHAIRPHYHLYVRIKDRGEHMCELSGDRWLCLLQARELAAFVERPLRYSGGVPAEEQGACEESLEVVKNQLVAMYDQGPGPDAKEYTATFAKKLHAAAVAMIWVAAPYVIVPATAMLFYWGGAGLLVWLHGDMSEMKGEFGEDVMMPMLAIVIPLAMVFARCLHVRVATRWVELRRRYLRNALVLSGIVFFILFGFVSIHDYCGWEWAGTHGMKSYIALGSNVWYFPIQLMQNYLLPDFFILVLLLPATYHAYLRERLLR